MQSTSGLPDASVLLVLPTTFKTKQSGSGTRRIEHHDLWFTFGSPENMREVLAAFSTTRRTDAEIRR